MLPPAALGPGESGANPDRPRTCVVLVRHGHVEGIAPARFRGRTELPLTEYGLRQAAATRDFLSLFVRPAAVYASPLSRCIQTGEILGQPHGCVPEPLPDFSDMDYGAWQGRTFDDVRASAPGAFAQWFRAPHPAAIPGAETLYDVAVRVARVLRMVVSRHQGETVLLVGHDSVNQIFLLLAMELPFSRYWLFRQSPCGVSFLEQSSPGDWIAIGVNETAHLGALSGPP